MPSIYRGWISMSGMQYIYCVDQRWAKNNRDPENITYTLSFLGCSALSLVAGSTFHCRRNTPDLVVVAALRCIGSYSTKAEYQSGLAGKVGRALT